MVLPEDVLERYWAVRQAAPLVCEVTLPVVMKKGKEHVPVMANRHWVGTQGLKEMIVGVGKKRGQKKWDNQEVDPSGQDLVRRCIYMSDCASGLLSCIYICI